MLDGRVKTLHPKIHAGILHDRSNKKHKVEMNKKKFPSIDLIVVNFYPFQKIVRKLKSNFVLLIILNPTKKKNSVNILII